MSSTLEVELFLHYCSLTNIFQQRELQVFHNYYYGFSLLPPCLSQRQWSEVAQWCLTLCDPTDCSLPGSSVHGIFQAIVLELIAISFSRGSSQPRDQTQVSLIIDRRFTVWTTSFSLILVPTCWMGLAFPWGCITSWYGLKNLKRDCVLQYISIFHEGGHI